MPEDESERESEEREPSKRRFGFRLPPIRLPAFFPRDFELVFPIPERVRGRAVGIRGLLVLALLVDLVDGALALTVGGPVLVARSFVVFVLALFVADWPGLLAVWELVAVLLGYPVVTAFPSVTVLLLVRTRLAGADRPGNGRRNHHR